MDREGNALNETTFPGNVASYKQLKEAVGAGWAIAFTGAGTSTPLYPTWISLLKDLINQAENEGLAENDNLQELRGEVHIDPLEVASHLEEIYTRHRFRARLAAIFESKRSATKCHELLVRLPLKAIVTLNYDDGLESAFSAVNSAVPVSLRAQDRAEIVRWQQGRLFGSDKLPILHWHGIPSDPEQMVFTGDDYDRVYNNRESVEFVGQLWRDNRLLVVGFGFSDPFLVRVVESTLRSLPSDNRHFALIGVPPGKKISALVRRQFTKKYRLTPIFYEIRSNGTHEDHSDLTELLSMLTEGVPNIVLARKSGPPATPEQSFPRSAITQAAYREFEKELLVSPGGRTLYVGPRLLRPVQLSEAADTITYETIGIDQVAKSSSSFVITTRPEYGSTTFCRRIVAEMLGLGIDTLYRDANLLPNYKNKLRQEFSQPKATSHASQVLVLDGFNLDRHERLLKEIIGLHHFGRVILIMQSSGPTPPTSLADGTLGINFEPLVLSHLERSDIRSLATELFDSSDTDMISAIVEKVYGDLLSLCIPLTPANVIMYLTILYKEGDFSPLNRVQIVDRYIQELLRRPSDAYQESFNAKNKMDLVSSFVYWLYSSAKGTFFETDWLSFCRQHMIDTLVSFSERSLLNELLACRIFVNFEGRLVLKYRFFYSYFLGRHIANRPLLISKLMEKDGYLTVNGLVEVITALSADNSTLIDDIVGKLENAISHLDSRYPLQKFDPFREIEWSANANEQERLWEPVTAALAGGPLAAEEVDKLKRSIQAERRTEDQSVTFSEFDQFERKIVAYYISLAHALNSSESLGGAAKKRALRVVFDACHLFYVVGLLYSPLIARSRVFFWNGLAFVNNIEFSSDKHDTAAKRTVLVASAIPNAVAASTATLIGSKKLGEVYRALETEGKWDDFKKLLLFFLLLRSKPRNWLARAQSLIASTERKSIYMGFMLQAALKQFHEEVNTVNEREELKTLVATIRVRRDLKKNKVGARIVGRVQKQLENAQYFAEPKN